MSRRLSSALRNLGTLPSIRSLSTGRKVGNAVPVIQFAPIVVPENAAIGTKVGSLSVRNGVGTYTFSEIADPDNKFTISGSDVNLAATVDYETKTSHSITIRADNGAGSVLTQAFSVPLGNIVEGTLGPTTATLNPAALDGSLIASITGLDAGANEKIVAISPNDGRLAIDSSGAQLIKGLSASTAGEINVSLLTSTGRVLNMLVTIYSDTTPTMIQAIPFNDEMAPNTISQETWLGRELALLSADVPNCTFRLANDAGGRFSIGNGKILRHEKIVAGALGSQYSPQIIARTPSGVDSAPITLTFTVSKFRFPTSRVIALFDYTDPSSMELDGNGRVIKITDKVKGCIREHAGGYANKTPGTNAPVYSSGVVTLTRAQSQYLKLAPDAVNNPIRQILAVNAPKFSHIIVAQTLDMASNHTFVSYVRTGNVYKTALRIGTIAQAVDVLKAGGNTATLATGAGLSRPVPHNDTSKPAIFALSSQGDVITVHRNDKKEYTEIGNAAATATTDITDCFLGCLNPTTGQFANMKILYEVIVQGELCPSELRGLWDGNPQWGIETRVDPKMLDLSLIDTNQKIYEDDFDTLSIETYENQYKLPSTQWVSGLGQQGQAVGCDAANATETAFHLTWNHPLQAKYDTVGVADGKLRLSTAPLSAPELTDAFYKAAQRGARQIGGVDYTHMGAAICTRAIAAPMYAIWEIRSKNPPAADSNFACLGWTLHDGAGHPPETDIIEQPGYVNTMSTGRHESPRWPELAGGAGSNAGSGRKATGTLNADVTEKYLMNGRALLDRAVHTYHLLMDRATDTMEYYQDGYLFYAQKPQKGVRISSFRTQNDNWAAGIGQGSGIIASNGTLDGTITVYIEGGGRVGAAFQNDFAVGIITIVGGKATKLEITNPGTYLDGSALDFKKTNNSGGVYPQLVADVQPTCYLEVGVNDPVFSTDFDCPMYIILNNAQGNFTSKGGLTGADKLTRRTDGFVDSIRAWKPKRAPVVITSPIQAAADAHCTNLFSALQASTGQPVPADDQNIINTAIAKMMGTVRRWDVPMDGSDPLWDSSKASLFDSVVCMSFFFGPFQQGNALNWKTLFGGTKVGAPAWDSAKGYKFDGRSGGGQYLDFQELLSDSANANLFRPIDNQMSMLLTQKPSAGKALLPVMGAGSTITWNIAADDVDPSFSFSHLQGGSLSTDRSRLPLPLGFHTLTRREQRIAIWSNGNMKRPHFSAYWGGRQADGRHSQYLPVPNAPIKVGSYGNSVQGFDGACAGILAGRWWTDEEHKAVLDSWRPYMQKYNVPGI